MLRVLFVCLGNICRSPTAHGVLQRKIEERGYSHLVEVDSAGTAAWHTGKKPDSRTIKAAATRGYDLSALRARTLTAHDFDEFDYVLVMDKSNLADAKALCSNNSKTKPMLFLQYAKAFVQDEVPDPYYGGADGFDHVLDLVEDGAEGLLLEIEARLNREQGKSNAV